MIKDIYIYLLGKGFSAFNIKIMNNPQIFPYYFSGQDIEAFDTA